MFYLKEKPEIYFFGQLQISNQTIAETMPVYERSHRRADRRDSIEMRS